MGVALHRCCVAVVVPSAPASVGIMLTRVRSPRAQQHHDRTRTARRGPESQWGGYNGGGTMRRGTHASRVADSGDTSTPSPHKPPGVHVLRDAAKRQPQSQAGTAATTLPQPQGSPRADDVRREASSAGAAAAGPGAGRTAAGEGQLSVHQAPNLRWPQRGASDGVADRPHGDTGGDVAPATNGDARGTGSRPPTVPRDRKLRHLRLRGAAGSPYRVKDSRASPKPGGMGKVEALRRLSQLVRETEPPSSGAPLFRPPTPSDSGGGGYSTASIASLASDGEGGQPGYQEDSADSRAPARSLAGGGAGTDAATAGSFAADDFDMPNGDGSSSAHRLSPDLAPGSIVQGESAIGSVVGASGTRVDGGASTAVLVGGASSAGDDSVGGGDTGRRARELERRIYDSMTLGTPPPRPSTSKRAPLRHIADDDNDVGGSSMLVAASSVSTIAIDAASSIVTHQGGSDMSFGSSSREPAPQPVTQRSNGHDPRRFDGGVRAQRRGTDASPPQHAGRRRLRITGLTEGDGEAPLSHSRRPPPGAVDRSTRYHGLPSSYGRGDASGVSYGMSTRDGDSESVQDSLRVLHASRAGREDASSASLQGESPCATVTTQCLHSSHGVGAPQLPRASKRLACCGSSCFARGRR